MATKIKKKDEPLKREKVRHQFIYEFTQEELLAKGKLLSSLLNDYDEIEDDFKQAKSEFKAKLDSKQAEINLTTTKVASGQEYRTDEVELEKDFDKCEKRYYYDGKLVDTIKMTASDYQTKLPLEKDKPEEGETKKVTKRVKQTSDNPSGIAEVEIEVGVEDESDIF